MARTNTELSPLNDRKPRFIELATEFNKSIKIIGEYSGYYKRLNGQTSFDSSLVNLYLVDSRNNSIDSTIFVGVRTPSTLEELNRGFLKETAYGRKSMSFSFQSVKENILLFSVKVDYESPKTYNERQGFPEDWYYITRDREILYCYDLDTKKILGKYQKRFLDYSIVFYDKKLDTITSRKNFNFNCELDISNKILLNCEGLNIDTNWVEPLNLLE